MAIQTRLLEACKLMLSLSLPGSQLSARSVNQSLPCALPQCSGLAWHTRQNHISCGGFLLLVSFHVWMVGSVQVICVSLAYIRCRSHGQRQTQFQPWIVINSRCSWTLLTTPALKLTYRKNHDVGWVSLVLKKSLLCDRE